VIYVYGAGGFGREVMAEVHRYMGAPGVRHIDAAFVDDSIGSTLKFDDMKNGEVIVAVGDPRTRAKLWTKCWQKKNYPVFPRGLVSPMAVIGPRVTMAEGILVMQGAHLTCDIEIDTGTLINQCANIGHDCRIGKFVSIQPGANLTGCVYIRDYAYIGIGATLICRNPNKPLIIGEGATVGGGAVVIDDVPPGATVVGNPARVIKGGA